VDLKPVNIQVIPHHVLASANHLLLATE